MDVKNVEQLQIVPTFNLGVDLFGGDCCPDEDLVVSNAICPEKTKTILMKIW